MKKQLSNFLKLLTLLVGICLLVVSCENETVDIENQTLIENGNNPYIKKGNIVDFQKINSYVSRLKNQNSLSRTESNESSTNFTVIEDSEIYVFTDSTGITTYTIPIQRDNQVNFTFSNLIVKTVDDNEIDSFILNYSPTQDYLNEYVNYDQTPFEGTIEYESLNSTESTSRTFARTGDCGTQTVTLTFCSWPNDDPDDGYHVAGANCTPAYMWSENVEIIDAGCSAGGGSGSSGSGTGGTSGGSGTGGGGISGPGGPNPTSPIPSDTCESSRGDVGITGSNGCITSADDIARNTLIETLNIEGSIEANWISNNASIQAIEILNSFLDESSFSNQNAYQTFVNNLLSVIMFDNRTDINALQFNLEAFRQDKIYNDLDYNFLLSTNHLTNIDVSENPLLGIQIQLYFTTKCAVLRHNNPDWSDAKIYWEASKDLIHIALDGFGMIPVVGEIADLTNGVLYLIEGDGVNATLSFAATVPIVGWGATTGKYVFKITASTLGTKVRLTWKVLENGIVYFGSSGNKLRKVLEITDSALHAHHLIPWARREHNLVQKAAKSGNAFHINEAINGIPRPSSLHLTGHSAYNTKILEVLDNYNDILNPDATIDEAYDFISGLANHIRELITNNPTLNSGQIADLISFP